MRLTLDAWAAREFAPGSIPPKTTLWRWAREGKIPATKLGRRYYVDQGFRVSTGNSRADNILDRYS